MGVGGFATLSLLYLMMDFNGGWGFATHSLLYLMMEFNGGWGVCDTFTVIFDDGFQWELGGLRHFHCYI